MRPSEAPFGGSRAFRLYPDTYGPMPRTFRSVDFPAAFAFLDLRGGI
jgi:hypothetical protein